MAVSINKWLSASFLVSFLCLMHPDNKHDYDQYFWASELHHPFHVSTIEINHNARDKTFEISCRIFTDDFEAILEKNYRRKVFLTNPPDADKAAINDIVTDYVLKHLQIKADGSLVALSCLGYEIEADAAEVYLEVDHIPSVKKIEVTDSILYDEFTDQIGIIHVIVGGKRKSTKLDYPDTQEAFQF